MRNSWKGYVCFSLSESLGLYKQTTRTCLCSFFFAFEGFVGQSTRERCSGGHPWRPAAQHVAIQTAPKISGDFRSCARGCCLTTKGPNCGRPFVLHPWQCTHRGRVCKGFAFPCSACWDRHTVSGSKGWGGGDGEVEKILSLVWCLLPYRTDNASFSGCFCRRTAKLLSPKQDWGSSNRPLVFCGLQEPYADACTPPSLSTNPTQP